MLLVSKQGSWWKEWDKHGRPNLLRKSLGRVGTWLCQCVSTEAVS